MIIKTGLAALAAVLLAALPAQADNCDGLATALVKSRIAPHHSFLTANLSGKTVKSEEIYVESVLYTSDNGGRWGGRMVGSAELEQATRRGVTPQMTCEFAGAEMANGDFTDIIVSHGGALNGRYWVSRARGVVLKDEMVNSSGATFAWDTYIYSHVSAPPQ